MLKDEIYHVNMIGKHYYYLYVIFKLGFYPGIFILALHMHCTERKSGHKLLKQTNSFCWPYQSCLWLKAPLISVDVHLSQGPKMETLGIAHASCEIQPLLILVVLTF